MLVAVSRRSIAQRAKTFTAPGSIPMQRIPAKLLSSKMPLKFSISVSNEFFEVRRAPGGA